MVTGERRLPGRFVPRAPRPPGEPGSTISPDHARPLDGAGRSPTGQPRLRRARVVAPDVLLFRVVIVGVLADTGLDEPGVVKRVLRHPRRCEFG